MPSESDSHPMESTDVPEVRLKPLNPYRPTIDHYSIHFVHDRKQFFCPWYYLMCMYAHFKSRHLRNMSITKLWIAIVSIPIIILDYNCVFQLDKYFE